MTDKSLTGVLEPLQANTGHVSGLLSTCLNIHSPHVYLLVAFLCSVLQFKLVIVVDLIGNLLNSGFTLSQLDKSPQNCLAFIL